MFSSSFSSISDAELSQRSNGNRRKASRNDEKRVGISDTFRFVLVVMIEYGRFPEEKYSVYASKRNNIRIMLLIYYKDRGTAAVTEEYFHGVGSD